MVLLSYIASQLITVNSNTTCHHSTKASRPSSHLDLQSQFHNFKRKQENFAVLIFGKAEKSSLVLRGTPLDYTAELTHQPPLSTKHEVPRRPRSNQHRNSQAASL